MSIRPLYRDPFNPVLLSADSKPLTPSAEQLGYIQAVLDIASSDSRFAQKAYDAIKLILLSGQAKVPLVTSLVPGTAEIGDPSFTLHVRGSNLVAGSVIIFAGQEEPTTHVSDSELTTGVNMAVWLGADTVPVMVQSPNGILSNESTFTFVTPALASVGTGVGSPSKFNKDSVGPPFVPPVPVQQPKAADHPFMKGHK